MYLNSESHKQFMSFTQRSDEDGPRSSQVRYSQNTRRGILRSRSHSSTSTYRSDEFSLKPSSASITPTRGSSLINLQRSSSLPFLNCFKSQRSKSSSPEKTRKHITFAPRTKTCNGKSKKKRKSNLLDKQNDECIELYEFNTKKSTEEKLRKKIPVRGRKYIPRAEIEYYDGPNFVTSEVVFDTKNCKITEVINRSKDEFLSDSSISPVTNKGKKYVIIDRYDHKNHLYNPDYVGDLKSSNSIALSVNSLKDVSVSDISYHTCKNIQNPGGTNDKQKKDDPAIDFRLSVHTPEHSPPNNSLFNVLRNKMRPLTNKEKKAIVEFCHLLERSKQLFNGLRCLAPYGNKQWQEHFGRTFDTFTKLWKFQQTNRSVLDEKYCLKRWQIGEIASKIGQLYYHFYLRTSDIAYLVEAFSFYQAIRARRYYDLADEVATCELMVKKLRYYARFIVVAILLRQNEILDELVIELDSLTHAYKSAFETMDHENWFRILLEVKTFIRADPGVLIIDHSNKKKIVTLSGRLNSHSIPFIERTLQMNLRLQEAVLIGSGTQVAKFSELTIDMFRILQNLEWEAEDSIKDRFVGSPHASGKSSEPSNRINLRCMGGNVNPHKYLLFMPSPSQALAFLGSAVHELPKRGALLIYISAEGYYPYQKQHSNKHDYELGGVITSFKSDSHKAYNREMKPGSSKYKNKNVLYPGDLQPFTRNPLVLIVDSDNSIAFQHITGTFGAPVLVLMSPTSPINDRRVQGSLFTLFLNNPIGGICNICDIYNIDLVRWEECVRLRDIFMKKTIRLLIKARIDSTFHAFLGCDILRNLIVRFVFCYTALRVHKELNSKPHLPCCTPPLPEDLIISSDLVGIILEIADILEVRDYFIDISSPEGRFLD